MPALTKVERERSERIIHELKHGEFYLVKYLINSRMYLKCLSLAPQQMASRGGDNDEREKEKNIGDAVHVKTDEGEFCHS